MEITNYCKTLYCDVAVAGGGVAGVAAGIEAARQALPPTDMFPR